MNQIEEQAILHLEKIVPSDLKEGTIKQLASHARNSVFEILLQNNWRESIPTRVSGFSPEGRRWIAELKTRFLTNPNLTDEKIESLIDLVLWHESQVVMLSKNSGANNIKEGGLLNVGQRLDITTFYKQIALDKLKNFLHIQVYTREVEKHIAQMEGNTILSYGLVADFLRDIQTLQALGLKAPQIEEILGVIARHPGLQFDEAILGKYRTAVQSALNAHYWMDPKLEKSSIINPKVDVTVTPLKGESLVPISNYESSSLDDHARDFNLSYFPTSIIDAMSSFNRSVIYDLTRTSPPILKKRKFLQRYLLKKRKFLQGHRKPDYTRITIAQDVRLKQLLDIS